MNHEKLVSIVIRTKNEEKWISSCLRSVFKQTYKNIEVIIVDNESIDRTVKKAKEYPVKIISIDKFIPGKAINDGVRASSGEYIVCLSGHCVPVNDKWLESLVKELDQDNVAGIYGRQEPLSFTSDLDKRDLLTVFGLDKKIQVKDTFFHNANSAFRREIWSKFPFDEEVTNIEDRVWGEKVIKHGFNIIYEPKASVYHWHGIHQDLNSERASNIVKILEKLDNFKLKGQHQTPEELKILAVIPVKGKMLMLNNTPLVEHTILSAKKSKFITDIVVATDNNDISKYAEGQSVESPFIRPDSLSEDYIDIFDVVKYVLDCYEEINRQYDLVVLLEEIYPFREDDVIDAMINQLVLDGLDTIVAGQTEKRSIWLTSGNETKLLEMEDNDITMPSSLKNSKATIGMIGMCCVTHVSLLYNNHIFSGKTGIFEIENTLSKITVRNSEEIKLAENIIQI